MGSPQGTATKGWTEPAGNWTLKKKAKGANEEGKNIRHVKHPTEGWRNIEQRKNMTRVHSAKETDKRQLTEDETPAKTANPPLRSRINTHSTQRVTTTQRAKERRTNGILRSKPRRKTQSRIHHKCETPPKVQNSQLKMRVSSQYETSAWSRAYIQHSLESQWRPHRKNSKLTGCRDL